MRLKENVNAVDLLNQVRKCSSDVWLETEEHDRLNLKSVLSQYVFVVMLEKQEDYRNAQVLCEQEDFPYLKEFLVEA